MGYLAAQQAASSSAAARDRLSGTTALWIALERRLSVAPRPLAKREAGGSSPARVTSLWLPYSSSAMRLGRSGLMVARLAGWTCCASTHRNRGRKLNRKENEEE